MDNWKFAIACVVFFLSACAVGQLIKEGLWFVGNAIAQVGITLLQIASQRRKED